jgi:nicotinamidase/pyrazinamidase
VTTDDETADIVVDLQNDFTDAPTPGSLPVAGGGEVAARVTEYLRTSPSRVKVATKDWHVDPGPHFAEVPDFVDTWPVHCRAGEWGSEFHPAFDQSLVQRVFY